jgi:ectoine hydroxylase-related dioxygenase (phytanoyl-CoA dioxygenase family)
MDRRGTDQMGLSFKGRRYFFPMWNQPDNRPIKEFIFGDVMADICRQFLGDTAFLAFEQFVVKGPEQGMSFAWHQDSGYVHRPHQPYLTCWCMLDDVTEENGTVYMLPYDRAGTRDRVEHVQDEQKGDLIGYFGDDPGVPVVAPAGSIACFASTVFHRSGPNTTENFRRIFLPQYSAEPILKPDTDEPYYLAEPFLQDGKIIAAY